MSKSTTLDWLGGDALRSQFFNAMSMIFPSGERYFVDSLRRVIDGIADPGLRGQVLGFIGQESTHHRMHAEFNRCLERLGLRNIVEPFIEWRVRHSSWLRPLDRLAVTAGVEHFTSLFARATLRSDDWLAGAPAELQALWKWHAAEEIEHGFVPLTVYRALGGGYWRRAVWFGYVAMTLGADALLQTIVNLQRSGSLWRLETWLRGGAFMLGRGGPLRVIMAGMPAYLRPGYTPTFHRDNQQVLAWLAEDAPRFDRAPRSGR